MTIQRPDTNAETYLLEPGDVYFIPRAYPHHIENLQNSEVHFLIFFDTPEVKEIGFSGAVPAFDQRVITPTLGLSADQFQRIPYRPEDVLLVGKTNPVD